MEVKNFWEYTDDELRKLWVEKNIWEFEKKYKELCNGDRIMNQVLGSTFKPLVDYCLKEKIISKTIQNGKNYYAIYLPKFLWWKEKYNIMAECQKRKEDKRKYAEKLEKEKNKQLNENNV